MENATNEHQEEEPVASPAQEDVSLSETEESEGTDYRLRTIFDL